MAQKTRAKKSPEKKSRLKGDPFAKSPDMTKQGEEPAIDQGSTSLPDEQRASRKTGQRTIFIKYQKSDGQIMAIQEILLDREKFSGSPWLDIPDDMEVKEFLLTAELVDK